MTIPIQGINHITFSVTDLDASVSFYQQVFEARLLLQDDGMAYLDLAGVWLALNVEKEIARREVWHSYTHIAFTLEAEYMKPMERRLQQMAVPMKADRSRGSGEGASLYFHDPDGHLLEVHSGSLQTRLQAFQEAEEGLQRE